MLRVGSLIWSRTWLAAALTVAASAGITGCGLFDFLTGSERKADVLWHVAGAAAPGPPARDENAAYFLAYDHHVLALDASSGAQRWIATTDTRTGPTYGDGGCSVLADVVACGDEDVFAFRRSDGTLAWRFHANVGYSPGFFPGRVQGNTLFLGSPSGTMYAIDGTSGTPQWVSPVLADDPNGTTIGRLSADDDIVVGSFTRFDKPTRGGVTALDAKTGAVRWTTYFPRVAPDSAAEGTGVALWENFVLGSSTDGRIYALDRATGAVVWWLPGVGQSHDSPGGPVGQDIRPITVSGALLFAGSLSGWLVVYDLEHRAEAWRTGSGNGSMNGSPIVLAGNAYVVHANGHLVAYSATHGAVLWELGSITDAFVASVAVADDRLFVSGVTGYWAVRK